MREELEKELRSTVSLLNEDSTIDYFNMLAYHMGWIGNQLEDAGIVSGKRIRPLLLLLCSASGNNDYSWKKALPAAAAIELLHNFSLLHDDIQDNSDLRRNRSTVWRLWGIPQAINAGDGLFALSNIAISNLISNNQPDLIIQIARIFNETCLNLTRGQYMDMAFEIENNLTLERYWPMISYKTAALISASTEIGAILGGCDKILQDVYRNYGHYLGLAYQVKDDILGIWGIETQTGKSTTQDLVTGKKTLPILYGIKQGGSFAERWSKKNITPEESPKMAEQLAAEGAKKFAEDTVDQLTDMAFKYIRIISPQGPAGEELFDITNLLLKRDT